MNNKNPLVFESEYSRHSALLGRCSEIFTPSSAQVIKKTNEGMIEGLRYAISSEKSCFLSRKYSIIRIDRWISEGVSEISSQNIVFLDLREGSVLNNEAATIRKISIYGDTSQSDNTQRYLSNVVTAISLIISKIDAGVMPDIRRILSTCHVIID